MEKQKEYSETIQKNLKTIIDQFEAEDKSVRERQIRIWKKLSYLWEGFSRIYWSETAHDWRIFDNSQLNDDNDQQYYDKNINVFKAFLESIIAAMTALVPPVKCVPDDANDTDDIATAKAGTSIAELVYKHNDAPLLMIKGLFIFCTQGMTAAYNYTDKNESYGTVNVNKYKTEQQDEQVKICPFCKKQLPEGSPELDTAEKLQKLEENEYDPGEDDVQLDDAFEEIEKLPGQQVCADCQKAVDPELKTIQVPITRLVGVNQEPKSRQCIEVFGGLNIKIANWASCQKELPYLGYSHETHYVNILSKYKHLREYKSKIDTAAGNEWYERWGRLSPEYYGEMPVDTPTVRNWWLRPCAFEAINDDSERRELYKEFPNGVKCVFINEIYAEACPEALDDHWTITFNPLARFLHFSPLGLGLASIQEITNDLISLVLQTIEHGVPQTFADPNVLNFKQYSQTEVAPGSIYPAKPKSGKSLADAFYEVKTATLSAEVQPFGDEIQKLGQFTSGAMPAIFGGNDNASTRTAAQSAMNRAQSLQRLQTPWKTFTFWWKNIFGKVVPAYIKDMAGDEYFSKETSPNNYVKVAIERAKLSGKIGSVELEAAEELPLTSAQVKDVLMQLVQMNNPMVLNALTIPQNLPLFAKAIGLNSFVLPGEEDREKQIEEISVLSQAAPMDTGLPNSDGSGPQMVSSIEPELFVDDHGIQSRVCREWLVSETGRLCKINNKAGYQNVLLHLRAHMEAMQQLQALMGGAPSPDGNPDEKGAGNPNAPKNPAPIIKGGPATQEENKPNG